jgi:hypothetical protein
MSKRYAHKHFLPKDMTANLQGTLHGDAAVVEGKHVSLSKQFEHISTGVEAEKMRETEKGGEGEGEGEGGKGARQRESEGGRDVSDPTAHVVSAEVHSSCAKTLPITTRAVLRLGRRNGVQ